MTLVKQLVMVIVTLFVLLFAGTVVINVQNTRDYLNNQLRSISQDTATSLGLTLSPHLESGETIVVESMVSAVFDSGYYREVIVRRIDGQALVERTSPVKVEGVPAWFVTRFPLDTPRGEALIMAGWQQWGTVSVASNPGYAYATLWLNSVEAFWWFLAASFVTFLIGMVALHFILRPLRAVEDQAKAICEREYPVQKKLPWTIELRSVVEAMNRMTSKVKEMFDQQAAAMERLRGEAYVDSLTGLANRRFFDMQLRQLLESSDHVEHAALLFIEIRDFKRINEAMGYKAGDELLRAMAALIREMTADIASADLLCGHLAGANFAILLLTDDQAEVEQLAERLCKAFPRMREEGLVKQDAIADIGIATYRGQNVTEIMSEADMALRAAQNKGANAWHRHDVKSMNDAGVMSATQWSEVLRDVLAARRIALHLQPVRSCLEPNVPLHQEILLRIQTADGNVVPAGVFIPMAKRLGLIEDFDRLVVQEAVSRLAAGAPGVDSGGKISINLFPLSVLDRAFSDWLGAFLLEHTALCPRLIFEVSEHGAVENLDALRYWVDRVRQAGASACLDHFGKGFHSFSYLSTLKIDYLKIDGGYIRGIQDSQENRFLVDSILKIAHGLDMSVIAESVETEAEWEVLRNLRLDGVQGYAIGKPVAW